MRQALLSCFPDLRGWRRVKVGALFDGKGELENRAAEYWARFFSNDATLRSSYRT